MTRRDRFGRGGVFTCCECGKRTRNTSADNLGGAVQMCPRCLAISLRTNTYLDNEELGHVQDARAQAERDFEAGLLEGIA